MKGLLNMTNNAVTVPWFLCSLRDDRKLGILLDWRFAAIAALLLTVTILKLLRDSRDPAAPKTLMRRVLRGQLISGAAVALCYLPCVAWHADSRSVSRMFVCELNAGLILGLALSALALGGYLCRGKLRRKKGNPRFGKHPVLYTMLCFLLLFALGIINRAAVLGPKVLTKGEFEQGPYERSADGVGVYPQVSISWFALEDWRRNQQQTAIPVYAAPDRASEVLEELPAGTLYTAEDLAYLSRPTTVRGWRYLPKSLGYAQTKTLLRAFRHSNVRVQPEDFPLPETLTVIEETLPLSQRLRNAYDRIFDISCSGFYAVFADYTGFITGQECSPDLGLTMSPLSLICWLCGFILAPVVGRKRK